MKQCRKTNTQITPVKYKHPMIKSKTNIQGHATTDKASFLKYIHTFANKHFSTAIQHTYIVKFKDKITKTSLIINKIISNSLTFYHNQKVFKMFDTFYVLIF